MVKEMIETKNLNIYPASKEQMEKFIAMQTDFVLQTAYTEMLNGALQHPEQWEWHAIWMVELKSGTHIGELSFKGLSASGVAEIGYGIEEKYQGNGYATEAIKALTTWALNQPNVTQVEAETEPDNKASQRVLIKCGFVPNGEMGAEGPRFVLVK